MWEGRDSLIFYRSFYEAIRELPMEKQGEIYDAIFDYSLNFNEQELTWMSKTVFTLIKPQLDANRKKYLNWIKPKQKQKTSKSEAKHNQKWSKTQGNVNDNVNVNDNIPSNKFEDDSFEMDIVKRFIRYRTDVNYSDTLKRELEKWWDSFIYNNCEEINKLKRIDKYTEKEIEDTIAFWLKNYFWSKQLHSLASIRSKQKFQKIRQNYLDSKGSEEKVITYIKKK